MQAKNDQAVMAAHNKIAKIIQVASFSRVLSTFSCKPPLVE